VKKEIWMLSCLLLLSMAGCETESSSSISKQSSSQQQTKEGSTVDKRSFTLTETERKAYENIKRDLEEKHLQRLSPVSIAKIYV
jgi:RecG-like helicase